MHNYKKIKDLDSGKITSLPNNQNVIKLMRHFSYAENKSHARHSFAYNESRNSYPQFLRSPLGTPGSMTPFASDTQKKKTLAFLFFILKKSTRGMYFKPYYLISVSTICHIYEGGSGGSVTQPIPPHGSPTISRIAVL